MLAAVTESLLQTSCYHVVVETIRVKILDPKAKRLLHDLEELKLIEIDRKENGQTVQRRFGAMKGFVTRMADDFDAPLEDFKDYM